MAASAAAAAELARLTSEAAVVIVGVGLASTVATAFSAATTRGSATISTKTAISLILSLWVKFVSFIGLSLLPPYSGTSAPSHEVVGNFVVYIRLTRTNWSRHNFEGLGDDVFIQAVAFLPVVFRDELSFASWQEPDFTDRSFALRK
jgi:hypothetical protein